MNIKELFVNPLLLFSNALRPVSEIAQMPFRPKRFRFEECRDFLTGQGKDIADFHFNKFAPFSWFVYYHDFVLIDIPAFNTQTLEAMDIARAIDFETSRLQACLQKGDYISFFSLIDQRIALEAYLQLFPAIPAEKRYYLFWFVFSRSQLKLEDFDPEFINEIRAYKNQELNLPADEQGYVEVYRGHGLSSPVSTASSWTLDINTAIFYARRFQAGGKVFRGKIYRDRVVASIKYRNEKEIVCFPENVEGIEEMRFKSLTELKPELERTGIMKLYESYSSLLTDKYFHKPHGIHGLSHTRRVLLLSLILSFMENLADNNRELLCLAALYHDIGRCNDNFDPQHGRESYKKAISRHLITLEPQEQEVLRFIIENHCISDHQAVALMGRYNVEDRERLLTLYKVFKDADGLDRIRINDLDVSKLRTSSAPKLLLIARELLEQITVSNIQAGKGSE